MAGNQIITGVNVTGNLTANDISVVIGNQLQDPPPKNVRFKVEKPIQTFTGREAFLEDLHKVVKKGQITVLTQAPISVVAATGGIGKTETVRMYIQLHAHQYDNVVWIDAEENSSAKNQFIQLGVKLNISTEFEGKPKEFELIRDQIFEKLLQNAHVVLLVFDNAEAFDDDEDLNLSGIRSLIPKSLSPFFVEPTVIVTSRNQNWNLQNVIQLDLWTEAEVVVFVIKRLGLQETTENIKLATQLGNIFGRLPIALQAAVAVILQQIKRKKKYGIQNVIDEYGSGSRKVLAQKPLDANMRPTHMSFTLLVLWNISLEKIVKFPDGDLAIKMLCFMAYLSPTRIPQDLLFALFEKDCTQDSFENALEILEDYSLITLLNSNDSDSHSFSIHRMIQDSTIENLRTNDEQKPSTIFSKNNFLNETKVLRKLSGRSINYIRKMDTRGLPRGGEIVDNLAQIANHVSENLDVKRYRYLTAKVADVLRRTSDFTKSVELYEKVLKATPPSDVQIEILEKIKLEQYLARAYSGGGFHKKSTELFKTVLEDETRALGPHHRNTLGTKSNFAQALGRMGKNDEAAAKFSEVLQDFRNIQDTQSDVFLTTKNNYALLLNSQGKTEEALQIHTQVLEEREKYPDLNSRNINTTKGNIALTLGEQGKLEEAAAMMLQNIEDATRLNGPFDLGTFTFKRNYATLLRAQGKHEEAAQHFLELLEIQETELGSEHIETLLTKNHLAGLYLDSEEPDKAFPLLDVEVRERVLGPDHLETMDAANSLAFVLTFQGKFEEALSLHNKTLKIQKQVLGPNYPFTLDSTHNIGVVHYKMEELDKASEVFQDLMLRQVEVFGESHPKTIDTLKWLTQCRKILDERNDLILKFAMLTSVDAETGQSLLKASNWNMETALDTFFNPKSTGEIGKIV